MADLERFADKDELRQSAQRLGKQLAREKRRTARLSEAVYQAASDALAGMNLPSIKPPKRDRRVKGEEVAVAMVSDLQLGKVTPEYDSQVAEERMIRYADRIVELTEIQRHDHPVKEIECWGLGDQIEGELIFPGQEFLIDSSLYRQVTVDGPRIFKLFTDRLLEHFERVRWRWVIGNHGAIGGRQRRNSHPETNADRMLGRILATLYDGEDRCEWIVPDDENTSGGRPERNWFHVARVGEYSCLLFHGDQIRGQLGFPWYGLGKKVYGWRSGAIREDFKDVALGHWHQLARIPLNTITAWANGSLESYNTYAQENLSAMSEPAQWLNFVHPERGIVTASYAVYLNEEERE